MTLQNNLPTEPVAPTPAKPTEPQAVTPPAETPASEPAEEVFDKDRAMETIKKLRDIEKKAKQDNKELERLKADEQKRTDAQLTESERLTKQLADITAQNAKLAADIIRRDVIAETGLPAVFADRLKGTTKDEMLADAKEIAKLLPPPTKTPPRVPPTNPADGNPNETAQQQRERLFGKQGNVFDMDAIRAGGGGVVWGNPTENK